MNVFSIPFSGGSLGKNQGCEKAPEMILKNIPQLNLLQHPVRIQNEDVHVFPADFPATQLSILRTIKFPSITIGGDHSTTYATFKAFALQHLGAALIVLDAHPDLMQEFDVPTHENYLRMLVSEGIVLPEKLVLLGIRSVDEEELRFLNEKRIKYFTANDCTSKKQDVCDEAMALVKDAPALFVSIDIDVVDPAFVPGTGYPEPAGISSNEALYFASRLRKMKNFRGADLVEVNPLLDLNKMTVKLAASIVAELC